MVRDEWSVVHTFTLIIRFLSLIVHSLLYKTNFMKYLFTRFIAILSLTSVLTTSTLQAQVRTKRSAQPQDLSALGISSSNKQATPTLSLSAIDATPLLLEDEAEALQGKPFRFGLNRAVDVDLIQAAAQSEQNGTRTYSYQITADGAFSLNLIFDRFQLKPGSKLYLYNADRTMLIGPITDAQNPKSGGEFWTDLVQGSTLLIDLQEPTAGSGTSELHLSSVVHAYKNLFPGTNKANNGAGTCHPNMVCYPAFQFEGDGVAMILTSGGSRACTGSMVNDMRQSFRSFFLTAFHCVDVNTADGTLTTGEISAAQNWLIMFNYQSATCDRPNEDDTEVVTLNGTTFRSALRNSDFALFELVQQVPLDVNTTYNGWNRGAATTSDNFGIHHPRGDVKKISFTNADTQVGSYGIGTSTHVISFWNNLGVTDPGSSGSPLFDGNRRIVGQLHGGPSVCGGNDLRDYYGRVFTSWTGGGTNSTRLSNWLDPDNTTSVSVTTGVKPLVSGPAGFTNASSFSLNTGTSSITAWTVTGGAGIVSPMSGTGNIASLTALSSGSNLTITFGVDAGQSYPIRFAKVFNTTAAPILSGLAVSPATVCAGRPATFTATVGNFSGTYSFTLSNGSSPISGTSSSTAFSQSVTASGSGAQVFTLTVANSFSTAAASTTLTVNTFPTVTITPTPSLTIGLVQSVTLTASGAASYSWSSGESTTAITTSVDGTYSVTGTTGGCSGTATVNVVSLTEVAGITVGPVGLPVDVNGGGVQVGDLFIVNFVLTNTGNDPTRFQIPNQATTTGPGIVSGTLPSGTPNSLQYSTDNGGTWTNVASGGTTTPSVAVNGTVRVRVPMTVQAGAIPGNVITLKLGNTMGDAQDQLRSPDGGDVYTVDNADGAATGEIFGSPTNGTREASFTQSLTVVVIPPPSITAQPASTSTVCEGASVVVTVGVSGSISGYQWLKGGSPVAGQTGLTLSLGSAQAGDAGVYSLSLTGPAGTTTSNNFTLTVNPVPVVTLTIPVGTTAQGSGGVALITLPPNTTATTFQASGGSSYERRIILDQITGFEIRQVDQNTSGIFPINRMGLFTLTVTGANGCGRTVQWVVQRQ